MASSQEPPATTPPTGADRRERRRRPPWLFALALVVLVYGGGLTTVGIGEALDALAAASIPVLVAAFGLEVAKIATLAMVHRSSATAVGGRLRYPQALNVAMSAFTLSQTVPGGGAVAGVVAIRRLKRFGLRGPNAAASVGLAGTLGLATITGIAGVGIGSAVLDTDLPLIALAAAACLFVALLGAAVGIVHVLRSPVAERRVRRLLGRVHERVRRRLDDWSSSIQSLHERPPTFASLARIVGWAALSWTADIVALRLVFAAFDQPVGIAVLLAGFGVAQLGTAIPVTPGGVGFVESGMIGAFVAVGQPASTATTIVLAYRVLATWLPSLAGMPALLRPPAYSSG